MSAKIATALNLDAKAMRYIEAANSMSSQYGVVLHQTAALFAIAASIRDLAAAVREMRDGRRDGP